MHFPQTRVIGAFGEHLLPWLQKWVFPEEIKFKDRAYACEAAGRFFDNLLASGTTTCQAFTTTASAATEELFDDAARRNMRLIAGLTGIDRLAPADYALSAENFYRDNKRLIERYRRQGRGLYAITPRNAHVMANNAMLDDPAEAERNSRQASAGGPPLQSSTTLTGGNVANQIVDIESFGAAQRNIKIKDPALSSVISAAVIRRPSSSAVL